jgi:hypothetical protein
VKATASVWLGFVAALLLAGCEAMSEPQAPRTQSIVALYQRPAERALISGMRQYEDGAFERAETSLRLALSLGLQDPRDMAVANKYLAFLACAFNRLAECEQHFRSAFAANPDFALSDVEVGHPVWGPVYRKVVAARSSAK